MTGPTDEERQAASDKLNQIEEKTGVNADYLSTHVATQPSNDYLSRKGLSSEDIETVKEASRVINAPD